MSSDSNPAEEKVKYLTEWMERLRSAEAAVPDAQRELDAATFQAGIRRALGEAGPPAEITRELDVRASRNLEDVKRAFPLMPDYRKFDYLRMTVATSTAATTSDAVTAVMYISRYANPSKVSAMLDGYSSLQARQERFRDARTRLQSQFPKLVEMLDGAEQRFQMAKSDSRLIPDTANAVRTFLYKLKGELFDKALHQKENRSWATMAERLCPSNSKQVIMLEQESAHSGLIDDLSDILKVRTTSDINDLAGAWMRAVDHVFVICGCIDS